MELFSRNLAWQSWLEAPVGANIVTPRPYNNTARLHNNKSARRGSHMCSDYGPGKERTMPQKRSELQAKMHRTAGSASDLQEEGVF
jgi:hypothetical protein